MQSNLSVAEPFYISMDSKFLNQQVTLRPLNSDDLLYFYSWASDPEVSKTMTWEAYTSLDDAEKFLKDVVNNHPWFYAICFEGKPVGSITLSQGKKDASFTAELGYVLARPYWGKGIMTVAVKQAIAMGFSDLGIHRIVAYVDPENIASQKVLEKCQMTCEGLLKEHILFKGILKDRLLYTIAKNA
jgi:RimJ/RimL family protein N-acetyltransferase